jgi:hypothetical protein
LFGFSLSKVFPASPMVSGKTALKVSDIRALLPLQELLGARNEVVGDRVVDVDNVDQVPKAGLFLGS